MFLWWFFRFLHDICCRAQVQYTVHEIFSDIFFGIGVCKNLKCDLRRLIFCTSLTVCTNCAIKISNYHKIEYWFFPSFLLSTVNCNRGWNEFKDSSNSFLAFFGVMAKMSSSYFKNNLIDHLSNVTFNNLWVYNICNHCWCGFSVGISEHWR